jgi:hypothetical protein
MPQNHFFLPELDSNIPVPKENAHWFNNDRKIILGISEGIVIDEQALTKGVSSIPDVWARPLLFQSAIRPNSKHPLKKKCIQEWRGLLSLLALHKVKPELGKLEIVAVQLDKETFSTALKNLSPNPVQLERGKHYDWTNVLMIRFRGIVVGAFSPTTLVYTGVDYNERLKNEAIGLKDKDGFLAPPQTKEDGLEYVGEWLYHLQQKLNPIFYGDQTNPDHQVVGAINELIDQWLKEIRQKLNLREAEPINVKTHKVSEDAVDIKGLAAYLGDYRVYERLLHPLVIDDALKSDVPISDILLKSSRKQELRVVVITEKILNEQINIWNEIRPKSLGETPKAIIEAFFNAPSGVKINDIDIGEKKGLWVRPELYFLSPVLLKGKGADILNEDERELNIGTRYILPFRKELLEFFSAEEITEKLSPGFKEDSGIVKFSFTLPIGNNTYKIEKTYKTKASQPDDGEIVETDIPILELFPDYLGEHWRRYYLFQGKAESFKANPIVHGESAKVKSRDRDYKHDNVSQKVTLSEISGDDCFPEAIELTNERNTPLGVILVEKKPRPQGLKHSWTVGIDFGTSNTNVYKNRGSADTAERWVYDFPSYYRSLTQSNGQLRDKVLEEYFFPTRKITLPIPTTLKMYNLSRKESMVLDYFIYYPREYRFPNQVLTDIKWDGSAERKTEYFLESLMFLLLIEVVKENVNEVQLACSYPKAFSPTNIEVFQREWQNVYDLLLKYDAGSQNGRILDMHRDTTADNQVRIKVNKPLFETEGIAAGEYFASELTIRDISQRANKAHAAICLDVGGGTTDISIWHRNKIVFDASVLLAGRQIGNMLQNNNRVRELLFSHDAAIALEEKKNESAYFSARLNLILKNEEEHVQAMLVKYANNKDVQWLRQIIALEFGALAFYAAEVCVATNEKANTLLPRITDSGINLHWGGNAAKLINWIDFGKYSRTGIGSKILNAIFFNCLNDKSLGDRAVKAKSIEQLQSPGHKSEASGGLVVMDLAGSNGMGAAMPTFQTEEYEMPDADSENQIFYKGAISGENIELTDRSVPFYMPLTNKDLFDENNETRFKTTTLERLIRFVEILNFFGIKNGLFNDDTKIVLGDTEKRIIRDGVGKIFIDMERLNESQRLIEPIFITEIKLLLDIIKSKMT